MTTRRGFLLGMLALGAAPAIVRAGSLMRLWVPPQRDVLTLDMIRQIKVSLAQTNRAGESYVLFVHPSWEEAMRTLAITGSANLVYRSGVIPHA